MSAASPLQSKVRRMIMEWQPIETYDALKKKPEFAIFFVQEHKGERSYTGLSATVSTERRFGSRVVSHWMPIEAPNDQGQRAAKPSAAP